MFKSVKLGSICNLVNGKAFKPFDWSKEGIRIVRIQNLNDGAKEFNHWAGNLEKQVIINDGNLLLAWSGTPGTSFGAHIWNRGKAILNQHIFRVDLNDRVIDPVWAKLSINYKLNSLIDKAHGGVGLQHVTKPMVEDLEIPLPPLPIQTKIAAILEKTDAVREKRRQANKLTDEFLQSVFLEMFGDPVTNPKVWKEAKLVDILERIDSGKSPVCLERTASDNEWGVLKLSAVTQGRYNESQNKALPENMKPDPEDEVHSGDVLLVRKNTYELVGRTALVLKTRSKLLLSDLTFRLVFKKEIVTGHYLWRALNQEANQRKIQNLSGGSAGSMPNVSKERLKTVSLLLPPLLEQQKFATLVEKVESLRAQQRESEKELENLFQSLMQRAFRGELVA